MSYPYRCSKCRSRRSLAELMHNHTVKCNRSSCDGTLHIDNYRLRNKRRERPRCNCDGYHFPHRYGSRYCNYSTVEFTDEEIQFSPELAYRIHIPIEFKGDYK